LPTGLGKTSIIAIWLLARKVNSSLPRRLVYVVNRRTVVDQTTGEIERYKLIRPDLAVSTLRGQFVDNGEWLLDPAREAVICGTVDMIGSRLLFGGYGIGFKNKPLHAGLLGQDTLIVHDEAHLEPAFQRLLLAIQLEQRSGRFPDIHPMRVLELTATSRGSTGAFGLTEQEKRPAFSKRGVPEPLRTVWQRTHAKKKIKLHEERGDLAAELATSLRNTKVPDVQFSSSFGMWKSCAGSFRDFRYIARSS
jgi:CRISPR-associated endonuclease/helicase Cas3